MDILVVEDSPTQAELLRYLLEQHSYGVTVADNGMRALEYIDKKMPSLVISDIIMPGMNGYELCKRIKAEEKSRDIPVILLTALTDSEDVLEGLACGADNFLTKPCNEEYLLSTITQILDNKKFYKSERVRIGVEIKFAGKTRFITADQQQMLSLLISTYEAAVSRNRELIKAQNELRSLNDHLEDMVAVRTASLSAEIAERKRAEDGMRVALAKYKTLFDCFPMGITVSDESGKIIESNPTAEKLLGVPQDEHNRRVINGPEWPIVRLDGTPMPPEEFASVRALNEKRMVENVEMGITKPDTTITWISVTASPLPLEGHGVVVTYSDISERKQAEKRVASQLEELRRWQDIMLDREDRMQELKREVNDLCRLNGEAVRYSGQEADPAQAGSREPIP
jgi:PAS domain S-box-containing protein